jgi:hypothetical protein
VLAGGFWNAAFGDADVGGGCNFNLVNTSASSVAVTIAVAQVNQGDSFWGFKNLGEPLTAVKLTSTAVPTWTVDAGIPDSRIFHFNIAAGGTETWNWLWGDPYKISTAGSPQINFTVAATPIPAAGLLLFGALGALGGLGLMSRRRKAI